MGEQTDVVASAARAGRGPAVAAAPPSRSRFPGGVTGTPRFMSILGIVIVVLIVLLVLGFFGRGRLSR
jgi:hypothetical protein